MQTGSSLIRKQSVQVRLQSVKSHLTFWIHFYAADGTAYILTAPLFAFYLGVKRMARETYNNLTKESNGHLGIFPSTKKSFQVAVLNKPELWVIQSKDIRDAFSQVQ